MVKLPIRVGTKLYVGQACTAKRWSKAKKKTSLFDIKSMCTNQTCIVAGESARCPGRSSVTDWTSSAGSSWIVIKPGSSGNLNTVVNDSDYLLELTFNSVVDKKYA